MSPDPGTVPKLVPHIMAAPNGARRSKADHPALPMRPDEIAAEARACFDAGAHDLHLHVRDAQGRHSLDPGLYAEAIAAVRETAPQMGIQITTESAGRFSVDQQYATLQALRPAQASVAVREMQRNEAIAARLYGFAQEAGTRVQHILYDLSDLMTLHRFQRRGILPETAPGLIMVFGSYNPPVEARPEQVAALVRVLRDTGYDWAACAFGKQERAVLLEVARQGGTVRIGFENNIHHPDGRLAESTAGNISAFVDALTRDSVQRLKGTGS